MKSPIASNYKAFLLLPVLIMVMFFISSCSGTRQVQDNTQYSYNPPPWAPAYGYRASTRYVFFPEIGVYYDLYQNNYIYPYGNSWVVVQHLPQAYASYDLRRLRQQQFNQSRDPRLYAPGSQNTIRDNPRQYTPRRGGTPTTRPPRNNPQRNQQPETVNPPVNTPRRGNQPAARPPQNTQERAPARTPVQTTPRRGNDPEVKNQQPVSRSQVPARVTPPSRNPRESQSAPPRTQSKSRRGGGGGV